MKKEVNIDELLQNEAVDALTYMGWEPTKIPPGQPQIQDVSRNNDMSRAWSHNILTLISPAPLSSKLWCH